MSDDPLIGGLKFIFDLLGGLISGYEQGKKALFAEHVEPLQARMLNVHKEYVSGFQEVTRHLRDQSKPPVELIEFLEARRRDYAVERDLAGTLAHSLEDAERRIVRNDAWLALKAYCDAVSSYCSPTSELYGLPRSREIQDQPRSEKGVVGSFDSRIQW